MQHMCSPDHGMALMLICLGLGVGLVIGTKLPRSSDPPPPT